MTFPCALWRAALAAVFFAVFFLPLAGCSSSKSGDPRVIKIVSSMPRTGSAKAQTDTIVNGIRLALDEAGNRVGDFKIVYADLDDATAAAGQWTAEKETSNAKRAARDPDVMVYIGTYNSGAAKIAMPILNRAGLLMISPANTATGLTKPGKGDRGEPEMYRPTGKINYVRVVPADDLQGSLSAVWAKELGARRVYVLDDNEVYGKGIATTFADTCQDLGLELLGQESIDSKAQEFKSLMTAIRETRPDLIYFGGTTQSKGGQVAKDMVAAGLDCKIMVPDACFEEALIESAGAENLNNRCYATFGGLPPDALTGRGKQFVEKYRARFETTPQAYAIYGYEAAKVALEAIRRAGKKDRGAIVAACLAIRDFDQGALGTWSFDENGDTTLTTISGSIVRDGKFHFVKQLGQPAEKSAAAPDDQPPPRIDPVERLVTTSPPVQPGSKR
jgi:branched-chain amino acid transport system substrate-binding protein